MRKKKTQQPTPNLPLLRKCLEWAESEAQKENHFEREWDQSAWLKTPEERKAELDMLRERGFTDKYPQTDCQTSYCIAGYALHVEGKLDGMSPYDLKEFNYEAAGQEALGLNDDQAEYLFYVSKTIVTVRAAIASIFAEAGERL